jgi:hypothetical protein
MILPALPQPSKTSKKRSPRNDAGVTPKTVLQLVERTFGDDLNAKTALSLAMGVGRRASMLLR